MRVLFSNLAYSCGIPEEGFNKLRDLRRYVWCSGQDRLQNFSHYHAILEKHKPDVVGLAEVKGKHFQSLILPEHYPYHACHNKYGKKQSGNCNGYLSKIPIGGKPRYFPVGRKRLYYHLNTDDLAIYFVHLPLGKEYRQQQISLLSKDISQETKPVLFMGDCNIFQGIKELEPLTKQTDLVLLNNPSQNTFQFGRQKACLDIAMISQSLADNCNLEIIPQSFSDHDGILVEL